MTLKKCDENDKKLRNEILMSDAAFFEMREKEDDENLSSFVFMTSKNFKISIIDSNRNGQ